jgi:4-hydroxy-L-threonine phosphate dehydrogenase PdxA
MPTRTPVALALGDPNGIGPEIAVKAAAACVRGGVRPILVGDAHVVHEHALRYAPEIPLRIAGDGIVPPDDGASIALVAVAALPPAAFTPGHATAAGGRATVAYVEAALALVRAGDAAAIVACPHSETAVNAAGIPFSGYPSFLARLCDIPADRVFLLLAGHGLRIVHATLHERLHDALARLDADVVFAAGMAVVEALQQLGFAQPRIGVFGVNPHAGENGLFGDDDARITAPAVARLRAAGVDAQGPTGADVMLLQRDAFDAFVAMYHDQGHIPVKLLAGRDAAALSIGTGFVFTSVGHGAAFDIAGHGIADPAPLLSALRLVGEIAGV